jgi:uncharacterized protein (DUF433 family)
MVVSVLDKHIEITPGVCGGKPRIAGHRIRVQEIAVWHEFQGLSPDEIVAQFPQSLSWKCCHCRLSFAIYHSGLRVWFLSHSGMKKLSPSGDNFIRSHAKALRRKGIQKIPLRLSAFA